MFALSADAFAHGKAEHGTMMTDDVQMQKLHTMMPMFSKTCAELESAIKKNDRTTVKNCTVKMLAALPDLRETKPHKNVKQRKTYVEMVNKLEVAVKSTTNQINQGNSKGAKESFTMIEEMCVQCHAKFRD